MTIHPCDIAARIAATEAIINQLEDELEPHLAPTGSLPPGPEPDPAAAIPEPSGPEPAEPEPAASQPIAIQPAPPTPRAPAPPPERQDGWTPERQARFLQALAATHNVSAAAREVGMTRQTAYRLRARLRGQPFDLAWDAAFQTAFDALTEAAMERALNGVEVPHLHKGEVVHTSRRYDERLTVALLAMRLQPRRAHLPPWHPASKFRPDDFRALVTRVAHGPATWDGREDSETTRELGPPDHSATN